MSLRDESYRGFINRVVKSLEINSSVDINISELELASITKCERCWYPVNRQRLILGDPDIASKCDHCEESIFKDFVIYVPEKGGDVWFVSVATDFLTLCDKELGR